MYFLLERVDVIGSWSYLRLLTSDVERTLEISFGLTYKSHYNNNMNLLQQM